MSWKGEGVAAVLSEIRLGWYQLCRGGRFLVSRATSTVSLGELMLLDHHLRDSLDSCIPCLILNNNDNNSNNVQIQYIYCSFSFMLYSFLAKRTYIHTCDTSHCKQIHFTINIPPMSYVLHQLFPGLRTFSPFPQLSYIQLLVFFLSKWHLLWSLSLSLFFHISDFIPPSSWPST